MNVTATDKNGTILKEGDVVMHGSVGARYRVSNAFENARGETQVQIMPMTGQAWMWVSEKDIELDPEYGHKTN